LDVDFGGEQRGRIGNATRFSNSLSAIEKVRKTQPAAYMKICALLVSKEFKVEHTAGVKGLSDEELEQVIAVLREMVDARAGESAKLIEGEAEVVPSLQRLM
jgi:hypothetical protein